MLRPEIVGKCWKVMDGLKIHGKCWKHVLLIRLAICVSPLVGMFLKQHGCGAGISGLL